MISAPGNLTPVFDILKTTPFEPVLLIPVGLAGIGVLMIQGFFFGRSKWSPAAKAIFAWFYFLFAAAIAAVSLWSYYGDDLRLRQAVRAGGYETVEGCLEAFHAMSETGHGDERLRVGGRTFAYSDFNLTPAFHSSAFRNGPIHRDSWVRIAFVGGDIVRLDVADGACPRQMTDLPDE